MRHYVLPLTFALMTHPAHALEVWFVDGDNVDVITVTHSGCTIIQATPRIDMTTSRASVVVDTAYEGRGTKDPLPIEVIAGQATLSPVADGSQRIDLSISKLDEDNPIRLHMDVDDELGFWRDQRVFVTGPEFADWTAMLAYVGTETTATFNKDGIARLRLPESLPGRALIS